MKTKIFTLILMAIITLPNVVVAQENQDVNLPQYTYCELVGVNANAGKALLGVTIGKSSTTVMVDFGQVTSDFTNNTLRGEDGKPIKFNSMIDAMNWFGAKGWEFVQAYVTIDKSDSKLHWLLRMDTSKLSEQEKEELLNYLKTKKDFK